MITTSEILGSFGRQWDKLVKLGPIFTEQVDTWAERTTRWAEKRPEAFSGDFDSTVYGFVCRNCYRPSERAIFTRRQPAVPPSVASRRRRSLTTVSRRCDSWNEDLVEERTRHLRPRAASVVRRLVAGEKIDDIAEDHGEFSTIGLLLQVYQADKKAGVR